MTTATGSSTTVAINPRTRSISRFNAACHDRMGIGLDLDRSAGVVADRQQRRRHAVDLRLRHAWPDRQRDRALEKALGDREVARLVAECPPVIGMEVQRDE